MNEANVNILIADHQQNFRGFLRRALEREQMFKVVAEATDADQAIYLAGQYKPELIVMDIDMPQGNGLEAARQIKTRSPDTKIILLSSLGGEAHNRAAIASGADAFLTKQAPVAELIALAWGVSNPSRKRPS
ncbi:MAG TPA: response regulator transcription factor [Terriglobia bacterium]|nr:response regulator transcription factor [Terriglobia bacterium]